MGKFVTKVKKHMLKGERENDATYEVGGGSHVTALKLVGVCAWVNCPGPPEIR